MRTKKVTNRKTTINAQTPPAMVVVFEEHRDFVNNLVDELGLKNTKEAFSVILSVAQKCRITSDRNNTGEEIDQFVEGAKEVIKNRQIRKTNHQIAELEAKIKELVRMKKELAII